MSKKATKKTLSMALAAALAFAPMQAFAASSDIAGHWAEKVITDWQNKGLISGYEDGTFKPNNSVTRAEFVIIMNNAMGFNKTGDVSFTDVQPGNWFYKAVATAVAQGYTKGYEDGTFKPNATISRAEAAVMIANAAGLEQDAAGAKFSDDIPSWALGSVGAVVKAGYMSGYPDGTFGAYKSITRAEAVSSLNRVIGGKVDEGVKGEEVVVKEAGTKLEDQTVTGNLVVDEAVNTGDVTVKNSTVKGDLLVKGGSTIYLDNVTVEGKIIVEKKDAKVQLGGKTSVSDVTVNAVCTLTASSDFDGKVGAVTVAKELGTDSSVVVKVPTDKINIDEKASVDVQKDAGTVTVAKAAAESKVYVASGVKVARLVTNGKASITGSGKVEELEVNVDGVTVSSNLNIDKTVVADGVKKPETSSGGGGGGSSSRPEKPGIKNVSIKAPTKVKPGSETTLEAVVTAVGNVDRTVKWEVTGNTNTTDTKIDGATGVLTVAANETGPLKVTATSNGDAKKSATVDIAVVAEKAESIKLDKETATVSKGSEVTFKATVTNNYGEVMESAQVNWAMKDAQDAVYTKEGIELVDGKLTVKSDAALTADETITVEATSEKLTAKATVTLKNEDAKVTSVKVTPAEVSVKKGATQDFTAEVLDQNGAVVTGKTVNWDVEGAASTSTDIQDGKLTVAADETNKTLTVKATEAEAKTVHGTATVTVLEASKPATIKITDHAQEVAQGDTLDFEAKIFDQYDEEMVGESVTWTVARADGGAVEAETKFTDATLKVADNEKAGALKVTATAKDAKAETTITVTEVQKPVDVKTEVKLDDKDKVLKVTLTDGTFDTTKTNTDLFTLTEKTVARAAITAKVTKVEFSADKKTAYLTIEVTGAAVETPMELTIKADALETPATPATPECGAEFVEAGALSKNTFTFKKGVDVTTDKQNTATIQLANAQVILADEVTLTADDLNGLTAKAKATDANTITVTFEGTPTEAKTSTFTLKIPTTNLTEGQVAKNFTQTIEVTVEENVPPVDPAAKAKEEIKKLEAGLTEVTIAEADKADKAKVEEAIKTKVKALVNTGVEQYDAEVTTKDAYQFPNWTGTITITQTDDAQNTASVTDKAVTVMSDAQNQDVTAAADKSDFSFEEKVQIGKDNVAEITVTGATKVDATKAKIAPSAATNGITPKVEKGSAENKIKVTFEGTPDAEAAQKAYTVTIPVDAITADSTHTAKELTVNLNVTVTKAQTATTVDKTGVNIPVNSDTIKVELGAGKKFADNVTADGSQFTIDKNVNVTKAEVNADKTVAYLTISGANSEVNDATLKIAKAALDANSQDTTADNVTVTAGIAVTAANPAEVAAKKGTDLNNKEVEITVTGATGVKKDGITIAEPTKAGITAAVAEPVDNKVKITLAGAPDTEGNQEFTVKVPASAITADAGKIAKDLEVTVTVNVGKADVQQADVTKDNVDVATGNTKLTVDLNAGKFVQSPEASQFTIENDDTAQSGWVQPTNVERKSDTQVVLTFNAAAGSGGQVSLKIGAAAFDTTSGVAVTASDVTAVAS